MPVGTVDSGLNRAFTLDSRSCDLTSISNKLIRFFFTNAKVDFFNPSSIGICQRIFWQNVCFRSFIRYHSWLSRAYLNDLCYWSQGFFIRKFLTVNHLAIRTVDSSLDSPFTLDSWSGDLTSITNQFIRILLLDVERNLLNAGFIRICQRILWKSVCFRSFIRYHSWLSRSNFDHLRYGS